MRIKWIVFLALFFSVVAFLIVPAITSSGRLNEMTRTADVSLGDMMALLNQPAFAVQLYDFALRISPNDTSILMKKGELLDKSGNTTEAEKLYDTILNLNQNETSALLSKGDLLLQEGEYRNAIGYYNRVLDVNPNDANTLVRKGDALLFLSIEDQQRLRSIARTFSQPSGSPGYSSAPDQTASYEALKSVESYKNAVECYQKAIQIDPKLSVFITGRIMGATQNQLNNYEQILKDIQGQ
jgi:tetratricopeptide (TPR) repeat protein